MMTWILSLIYLTRPTAKELLKFETAAWKGFVYCINFLHSPLFLVFMSAIVFMFCYGLYALWDEPYFLDNAAVARGWPNKFPSVSPLPC